MAYSGSTSLEFHIERYVNKISGEIKTLDQVHPEDEYMFNYEEITLYVKGNAHYIPGSRFGNPENYAPEDSDSEITSITCSLEEDWENRITEEEREKILTKIVDQVSEQEDFNEDDDEPFDYGDDLF